MLMPHTSTMLLAAGLDSHSSLHSIPSLHSNQEGDFRLANEEQQKAMSLQGALSRWDSEHREPGMGVEAALFPSVSQQKGSLLQAADPQDAGHSESDVLDSPLHG